MENLLKEVRGLTRKERKELAKDGIYLLNMDQTRLEEIVTKVLDLVFAEGKLDEISWEDEQKLVEAILVITFSIKLEEEKN